MDILQQIDERKLLDALPKFVVDNSVFFVDDNENDDENDEIVSNFRRRD